MVGSPFARARHRAARAGRPVSAAPPRTPHSSHPRRARRASAPQVWKSVPGPSGGRFNGSAGDPVRTVSSPSPGGSVQRFLTLTDVAEVLNVSVSQARALVRTGDLQAIQVGGRGQWRIEESWLDEFVERQRAVTRERVEQWTREDAGADR
ncbi:DNA-binding protein [Micrococcus flavus]|nr:DNA-binding protein [Micrococcus flavus]